MKLKKQIRLGRMGRILGIWPGQQVSGHGYILLSVALWSTIAFLLIQRFVVTAVVVEGRSMTPTLMPGDRCIVNCVLPHFRGYQRGDLVVVRDRANGELMVKRIIGLPNDHLQFVRGRVYLNGEPLDEPYVAKNNLTYSRELRDQVIRVASDSYFVMGDNRLWSEDSRAYGDIDRGALVGLISR